MGLLDRLAPRRTETEALPSPSVSGDDSVYATKALRKLLGALTATPAPVLLDLGPVVGSNVSFFGEQIGCKIFVEDIFADLERHLREGTVDQFPAFLQRRFHQGAGTVDGVLCWDILDYLDKPSARVLATELMRMLRPDGALLGFFANAATQDSRYTKYVIVDEGNLKYRPYPATRPRRAPLPNGEIIKLFSGMRVAESFLLLNNLREILFRNSA